jgi:hypothetical protein
MQLRIFALGAALALSMEPSLAQTALDTAKIEQIIGVKGTMIADENVFKVGRARNEVEVHVNRHPSLTPDRRSKLTPPDGEYARY